jgi:hypothetical protein
LLYDVLYVSLLGHEIAFRYFDKKMDSLKSTVKRNLYWFSDSDELLHAFVIIPAVMEKIYWRNNND